MGSYDDFKDGVEEGAKLLAREIFHDFEIQAKNDAGAFLEKTKTDMQRWTRLLAEGKLTEQDFGDLVQAKKALAEIHGLSGAGIATAKLERFRTGLITLVVDTAFDTFV